MDGRLGVTWHSLFTLCVVALVCAAWVIPPVSAASDDDFDLSITDVIETPERTVTVEGKDYTVDAVAQRSPGDAVSISVQVNNSSQDFFVDLYNADEQVEDWRRGTGNETVTFDGTTTSAIGPGSYAAVLTVDSLHRATFPVVIAGYDVTLSHPASVEKDGSTVIFNISVSQTEHVNGSPKNGAEVALWANGETIREPGEKVAPELYRASINTSRLQEGTYRVYAGARGEVTSQDEYEALGVAPESQLEVQQASGGSGGGSGGFGTIDDDDDSTTENTTTNTSNNTTQSTTNTTNTTSSNTTSSNQTELNDSDDKNSTSGSSIILPDNDSNTTENPAATDADEVPLLGAWILGGVVLIFGLGYRFRKQVR